MHCASEPRNRNQHYSRQPLTEGEKCLTNVFQRFTNVLSKNLLISRIYLQNPEDFHYFANLSVALIMKRMDLIIIKKLKMPCFPTIFSKDMHKPYICGTFVPN